VLATKSVIAARLADSPDDATDRQLLGVAASAGMGFTVAIFIVELALTDPTQQANAKLGIVAAAVIAAGASLMILMLPRVARRGG
jgi:NhaA family Na+:H+ antiporter